MKSMHSKSLIPVFSNRSAGIGLSCKFLSNYGKLNTTNTILPIRLQGRERMLWQNVLPSIIIPSKINNAEDWKQAREKLLEADQNLTPVTVDSVILNFCIKIENYSLANSYLEYMKVSKKKLNLAILGKCFKLFYLLHSDKTPSKIEEQEVFNRYKEIRETYEVLDSQTCENAILALCLTQHWQESLKLLNEIKISCVPNSISYSAVVASAFKNKHYELGWELLEETIYNNRLPMEMTYNSYLDSCKTSGSPKEFLKKLEILFEFIRINNVDCNLKVVLKLIDVCQKYNIHVHRTTVINRGFCLSCQQKLEKLTLNEHNFEDLKKAIFENVIVGKNVFYRTTPTEIENFKTFLASMKKYDVVIDGLNVAYCAGTSQPPHILAKFVISVVEHFIKQNKEVLVLGRTHMMKWPNWKQVSNTADTFLAQSLSHDDPYLLYCALNCGLNTMIVSKDLMRSHLFRLKDPYLKIMLSQWLNQNQLQLTYINNQGKAFFKNPQSFLRTAQHSEKGWHIPYTEDNSEKWLCICSKHIK